MIGEYYKFFECCVVVKGANRAAIYDLQRLNFHFIPNSVIEVFKDYENKKISSLYNDYASQKEQLEKYFKYLLTNELIFKTDNPESFPKMSSVLEKPHVLDFLFLEIDDLQNFKLDFLENCIDKTGLEHLVVINSNNSIQNFETVLNLLNYSRVKMITFISVFDENLIVDILKLKSKHERLKKIIFVNSPIKFLKIEDDQNIDYFPNSLEILLTRRIKSTKNFTLNTKTYLESLNNNLYFNRKVYISNSGEVKPSFVQKDFFGNIEKENLNDIILKDGFQRVWKITKDEIEVCKDCEFRYMCPDNRIPLKNDRLYYHETSCSYNPYTNKWKSI